VSPVIGAALIDDVFHARARPVVESEVQFRPPTTAEDYRTLGVMIGLIMVASLSTQLSA